MAGKKLIAQGAIVSHRSGVTGWSQGASFVPLSPAIPAMFMPSLPSDRAPELATACVSER